MRKVIINRAWLEKSRRLVPFAITAMDANTIVFATGGYDHSIKFWYPHDGVCYRTAQHPESVGPPINAHQR